MSAATLWKSLATILVSAFLATDANALFRAYLSATGSDSNPCTLPAPCRLLPAALAAVDSGGQIWILDSANYNTASVAIGKSVSIVAVPGVIGSVLAIGGPAINVGTPAIKVSLRNVVIGNLPGAGGIDGLLVSASDSQVALEDCLVENMPGRGVSIVSASKVQVTNSTVRNTGESGVYVAANGSVVVTRSRLIANPIGVWVNGTTAGDTGGTVSDSLVSGGSTGISASSTVAGAFVRATVTGSTIEGNFTALHTDTGATTAVTNVYFSGNTITNNYYSFYANGLVANMLSLGHNNMLGNTSTFGVMSTGSLQ